MRRCRHPQKRKNSQAVVTSSFLFTKNHVELLRESWLTIFFCSLQPVQYQAFASKIDGQLSSRGVKKLIQINFFTPLTFFEFDQSSDASQPPSSEKKKLASRGDFLVFLFRKNHVERLWESWLTIFCSLQPVQCQAFASKIDGQLSEIFFPLHRVSAQVLIFACWKTKAVCWKIRSKTKQKS